MELKHESITLSSLVRRALNLLNRNLFFPRRWRRPRSGFLRSLYRRVQGILSSPMWITLLTKHVKTTPQRLLRATPPLVLLACTVQGPNTSSPTLVKGGPISALSGGKSAMFCSSIGRRTTLPLGHVIVLRCRPVEI